jgi:hypothetical protein
MNEPSGFKLRLDLLTLAIVGNIFVALGLANMFGGVNILPAAFQFDETGGLRIGLGVVLILPFFLDFLKQVGGHKGGDE